MRQRVSQECRQDDITKPRVAVSLNGSRKYLIPETNYLLKYQLDFFLSFDLDIIRMPDAL